MTASSSGNTVQDLVFEVLAADDQEAALRALAPRHPPELLAQVRATLDAFRRHAPLDAGASGPVSESMPERLGHLRLLRRLGAGGMGVVYLALDEQLGREVAVKVVRPEMLYFPGQRERFRREVAVIARLKHPGIVPVYAVGEHDGVPWFSMEHVDGVSLATLLESLRDRAPASLRARDLLGAGGDAPAGDPRQASASSLTTGSWAQACVQLIREVADALCHAHEHGVLHRDLKPSNILLGRDGRPRLVDFGLAHAEDAAELTRTGAQIGSLPYMPPEFLGTKRADATPQGDVYSLGVTLYELLTLSTPFFAETIEATTLAIRLGGPRPPRAQNRAITWDLETVCLKAMDRAPARRYASAAALRADLDNLLARRPIDARRASPALRARRWVQRHPTATVGLALGTLAFVVAPALLVWHQARALAEQHRLRAAADERSYDACVIAADQSLRQHRAPEALANLELAPEALRGFEWRHLRLQCDSSLATVLASGGRDLTFTRDGSQLVVACADGALRVFAGPRYDGAPRVLEGHEQAVVGVVPGPEPGAVSTIAADGELRRFDLTAGTATAIGKQENADALKSSADGSTLVARSPTSGFAVWRPPYGHAELTFGAPSSNGFAFLADGRRLLTSSNHGVIELRDLANGSLLRKYPSQGAAVVGFAVLPAGDGFVTVGRDSALRLWQFDQNQPARVLSGHASSFSALATSADGTLVFTALDTGTVVVRDVRTLEVLATMNGHAEAVKAIAPSPVGSMVATAAADGTVRLWDPPRRAPSHTIQAHDGAVRGVAVLDAGRAVSVGSDGRLCLLDLGTFTVARQLTEPAGKYRSLALTPDRTRFVAGTAGGELEVWDARTVQRLRRLPGHTGEVYGVGWDPAGRAFASAGADGRLLVWEDGGVQPARVLVEGHAPFTSVAFEPAGGRVAASARSGAVELFSLRDGSARLLGAHAGDAQCVAFDPEGRRLASCGNDHVVQVFDLATGAASRLDWNDQFPQAVLFSADGRRLAAAGLGGRIRIWNLASGRPLLVLEGHRRGVFALAWTPDEQRLLTASWDGTVRVWESW